MKKINYLFIFIFSFSVLSAQEKLSKEEKARREKNIQAGNPFAQFGYKAKIATLSKGKYLEFHDLDSIVTIGTVRWHVYKNEIVGRIVQDSLNPDAQPIGDRAGRWISPDPLSEEFPSWSPYTMSFNNPIKFKDPDGRAPVDWVNFTGKNGQQQIIFDSSVKTKADAAAKGYTNVKQVFEAGIGRSEKTGEVVNFQKDGKYSVNGGETMNVDDTNYTTKGGTYIGENKGIIDAIGDFGPEGLQKGGDAMLKSAGVAALSGAEPVAAGLATVGSTMSAIGAGGKILNDAVEGKFDVKNFAIQAASEAINLYINKIGGSNTVNSIMLQNGVNEVGKGMEELNKKN
jgi:hypothetical protein